jgi:hypothetical protein
VAQQPIADLALLCVFIDRSHTIKHTHTWLYSSTRVISSSQTQLPTQHTTTAIDKYPCPQWNPNPRSQHEAVIDVRLSPRGYRNHRQSLCYRRLYHFCIINQQSRVVMKRCQLPANQPTPLQTTEMSHEGPGEKKKYSSTLSLTSALEGGGWLTPRPGRFNPGKDNRCHFTGGWVGPRAGVDGYENFSPLAGIRSPDRPALRKSLYRLSYRGPKYCNSNVMYEKRSVSSNLFVQVNQKERHYIKCLCNYSMWFQGK